MHHLKFLALLALIASTMHCSAAHTYDPSCNHCYVQERLHPSDKRYATFVRAFQLMQERNAKMIVETGTARSGDRWCIGDGCSTLVFSKWAQQHNALMYSVDIDPQAINNAKQALPPGIDCVIFHVGDSVAFLQNFDQTIDFLYLDSYDFDFHNPHPSQHHHLKEIVAAYHCLTDNSVVMIDDCELPHGGKGKLIIEYLLERGWVIDTKGYQVIMVKN